MFFWDGTIVLMIPALLFAIYAQWKVKSAFARYSQVRSHSGLTGAQVAQELLRRAHFAGGVDSADVRAAQSAEARLAAVRVQMGEGTLTDHYDPRTKVLSLSPPVYGSNSLAALGVAAHETGHALQHATGYAPLGIRSSLVPAAQVGSTLAWPLFFGGLIFAKSGLGILMDIGIWLYVAAVIFTLVTLPVEFNASRRAVQLLQSEGFVDSSEVAGTKAVLNAAAMTYVAAAAMAIMTLIRLLILRDSRD